VVDVEPLEDFDVVVVFVVVVVFFTTGFLQG
jgi:hypothetical protein